MTDKLKWQFIGGVPMNVQLVTLERKTEKRKIQAVHKSVSFVYPKGIIQFKESLYCQKVHFMN